MALPWVLSAASADDLFRKGFRAQRHGRMVEAYLLYSQARALEPANTKYARAASRVRGSAARLLARAGQYGAAVEMAADSWEYSSHPDEDAPRRATPDVRATHSGPSPTRPARLIYADHEASFRFRGTLREAYEDVANEFGVRVVFRAEFDGERDFHGDLDECDFPCVMRVLSQVGKAFAVPLDDTAMLVADYGPLVPGELEPVGLASIPLDRVLRAEDVAEVSQTIQQVLDIPQVQALVSADALVLRTPIQKIEMARTLAEDLLRVAPSVHLEIRMLTVAQGRRIRAGIDVPGTFPVTNLSTLFGAMPNTDGVERLVGLGGGKTVLGVAVGDATVEARLNSSSSQSVHSSHLRGQHGMEATFKVGESYPIATAQFSAGPLDGPRPGSPGYVQPPPSVRFEDLGLSLVVTPLIHRAREVSLALEVTFKFLAGAAVNGVPILSNREFQSQVRLRENEFAIVSGASVYERRRTGAGFAGLASLPFIGNLFRRNEYRWDQRDLLILIRPRILRLPPSELAVGSTFLYGSEQRPVPAL